MIRSYLTLRTNGIVDYSNHWLFLNYFAIFRQSIDLYSSVPSPSIGFLGTPSLTRLGSSFLSSSLTRRHTPESITTASKPLLPQLEDEQPAQQRCSSYTLLPPSRRSSIRKDEKSKVSHELPISRQSSFAQAVANGNFFYFFIFLK